MSEDQTDYNGGYFIGIDNGLDGGVVVLSASGAIVRTEVMPVNKIGKGRMIDITELARILNDYPVATVICEEASKHSPGKMALCSTWFTYGQIVAMLKLHLHRYQTITPQTWQRVFWTKSKVADGQSYDTKSAALEAAKKLWPEQDWLASARSSKPHDGMVDAALIAEFGRRLLR